MKETITDSMLLRFMTGDATREQTDLIGRWLEENPEENQKRLNQVHAVLLMGIACDVKPTGSMRESRGLWRTISHAKISRYVIGAAAVFLISFGLNYAFFLHKLQGWSEQTTTIEAPIGQHLKIALNDGSVIDLNSGSRIVYPSIFAENERRVKLYGEGMFDVEHDDNRPFIVETYACDVKVLGTQFNVIADESCNLFSTALLRGCVSVTDRRSNEQILMTENTVVTLENGRFKTSRITNHDDYLWTEGIISASGIPFDQLVRKLEKSYNVKIVIDRTTLPVIKYQRCKIRIADGINHAMAMLQAASDFTYHYDEIENVIVIK